eukprot:TRINITY_DN5554_c0_g1_i2.p1 TRINITY_DN5554_c0_g1~~TRINITY_DN5554_c0_g1_i2.p1  ORF type:complete len:346 (-),score=77.01 TRINITY_DN5554_c0_g1_i2:231-1268(-)
MLRSLVGSEMCIRDRLQQHCRDTLHRLSGFDPVWAALKHEVFSSKEAELAVPVMRAHLQATEFQQRAEETRELLDINASVAAVKDWKGLRADAAQLTFQFILRRMRRQMLSRGQAKTVRFGSQVVDHMGMMIGVIRNHVCAEGLYMESPEVAMEFLRNCMEANLPQIFILRLIMLFELTSMDGISDRDLGIIKRWVTLQYGRLALVSLLSIREGLGRHRTGHFCAIKRKFNLFPGSRGQAYVPVVARLLQMGAMTTGQQDNWAKPEYKAAIHDSFEGKSVSKGSVAANPGAPVVLLLPGGVTPGEVQHCKQVAQQIGRRVIILTSKIISGHDLIQSYAVTALGTS